MTDERLHEELQEGCHVWKARPESQEGCQVARSIPVGRVIQRRPSTGVEDQRVQEAGSWQRILGMAEWRDGRGRKNVEEK